MAKDEDHTTTNFTLFPEVLLNNGADTHALGKVAFGGGGGFASQGLCRHSPSVGLEIPYLSGTLAL